MRTKSTGGFTLIELLIVIAIIGILAAVLIPNLMNARNAAQERAAQAHSSSVYTAMMAHLAENPTLSVADAATAGETEGCGSAGTIGNYGWSDPPSGASCTITEDGGDFRVEVTLGSATFVNGAPGTATTP